MAVEWYRMYHGAPTDPCWLVVGRRAGVVPGLAWSVWTALLDRASRADDRGSVEGFDVDAIAAFFGYEVGQVEAVVAALVEKGMLSENRVVAWEKRQVKRPDDNSLDRVRRHRETKRSVTHGNAVKRTETPDKIREEKNTTDTSDDVVRVFAHWVRVTGRDEARTKLTDGRRKKIRARLKTYSVDDLLLAIDGVMLSDFHAGKPEYNDLVSCFSEDSRVGSHIERARQRQAGVIPLRERMTDEYLANVLAMAGDSVWNAETRDAALFRVSKQYEAERWDFILPYLLDLPWAEAVAARSDKWRLKDVLKRHIDRVVAHAA